MPLSRFLTLAKLRNISSPASFFHAFFAFFHGNGLILSLLMPYRGGVSIAIKRYFLCSAFGINKIFMQLIRIKRGIGNQNSYLCTE